MVSWSGSQKVKSLCCAGMQAAERDMYVRQQLTHVDFTLRKLSLRKCTLSTQVCFSVDHFNKKGQKDTHLCQIFLRIFRKVKEIRVLGRLKSEQAYI